MTETSELTATTTSCEECGKPAIIHVSDNKGGVAQMRHFCAECAEHVSRREAPPYYGSGNAAVLIVLGLTFMLLSAFADHIKFGGSEGFGPYQMLGAAVGGALVLLGGVAKVRTFVVLGALFALLSLLADYLKLGGGGGFGTQQILGVALGFVVLAAGVQVARTRP